jgi:hypothetical protein
MLGFQRIVLRNRGSLLHLHFERVTSHTNAAILAGRTSSGILAQVLVSVKWMPIEQLNYISLGGE